MVLTCHPHTISQEYAHGIVACHSISRKKHGKYNKGKNFQHERYEHQYKKIDAVKLPHVVSTCKREKIAANEKNGVKYWAHYHDVVVPGYKGDKVNWTWQQNAKCAARLTFDLRLIMNLRMS